MTFLRVFFRDNQGSAFSPQEIANILKEVGFRLEAVQVNDFLRLLVEGGIIEARDTPLDVYYIFRRRPLGFGC